MNQWFVLGEKMEMLMTPLSLFFPKEKAGY